MQPCTTKCLLGIIIYALTARLERGDAEKKTQLNLPVESPSSQRSSQGGCPLVESSNWS